MVLSVLFLDKIMSKVGGHLGERILVSLRAVVNTHCGCG